MPCGTSRTARSRPWSASRRPSACSRSPTASSRGDFGKTDFVERLPGIETYAGERKVKFQGLQPRQVLLRVASRLTFGGFDGHPMIEHFKFLKAHAKASPKMTIPSPSAVHFRQGREAVPEAVYPDIDDFYRDLGQTYRKVVRAFADAGCRHLQLDEVNLAYLSRFGASRAGPRARRRPRCAAGIYAR